ncbi:MAG TPA: hypothetical protein VJR58_08815 [Vineibacter sp.]|nr:hypothetical protein [Vineibacter sp.]
MPAFIHDLERQAQSAARNEADYRIQVRDRLAQFEAARVAAYRRLNLLKGMAAAIAAVAEEPAALEAGVDHVCTRTDWSAADAAYAEVRARLLPVAMAMRAAEQTPTPQQPAPSPQAPILAFASFEAWYRGRFDADFLSLLANDPPTFQSVVDF